MNGLPEGFVPDAQPAGGAFPEGFQPDATTSTPPRTFSGAETFGLNAANLFGAGPTVYSALKYIAEGDPYKKAAAADAARADYQGALDTTEADDEHAWARRAGKLAALGGETLVGGGVGKALSIGAKGVGLAAKLAPWAEANPIISKVLAGAGSGAAYGAASGAGTAASKGQDVGEEALKGAGVGAVLGGALSGVGGVAGKLLKGAPEHEEADLLRGITNGTGEFGGATATAKKIVSRDKEDIIATLRSDPELRAVVSGPAKEAMPLLQQRLEQTGSKLDPLYDVVDRATGGVSVHGLVNTIDDEIQRLGRTPLNELYVNALKDIKQSALNAWAPDLEKVAASQGKLAAMGIETPLRLQPQDVMVPTRDVRAMVTRLQTRGSQVINPLNPGEASQMKADIAGFLKGFLDSHLDVAAEQSPATAAAVKAIYDINPVYSALKNMMKAVEQRAQKEGTGSVSMGGNLKHLLTHGAGGAAAAMLLHGNLPGAAVTGAGALLASQAPRLARGATTAMANLERAVAAGNPKARALMDTLTNLRKVGTAGAGHVGNVTNSTGAP
jgi:hypothetical protein